MDETTDTLFGQIPSHWNCREYEELLEPKGLSYGIVQPGSQGNIDGVPVLKVNNIRNGRISSENHSKVDREIERNYSRTRLKGGELLVTVVGTVGECVIVPKKYEGWNVVRAVSVSNLSKQVDSRFVMYCFSCEQVKFQLYGYINDTVQPTLNLSSLKRVLFPIPPLPEQRAIAEVLSSLDDKIDLLHRQNKTLEALAETLFRQWFVEEAEEGWEVGRVDDIFVLQRGHDLPIQNRIKGKYPILTSSGIGGYHNDFKSVGPGVTTGRSGVLGNVFYIRGDYWPLNTSLYVKEFKRSTPFFAYFYLKTLDLASLNGGSAVPTLNRNDVHNIEATLPPLTLIHQFEAMCQDLFKKIHSNEYQISTLTKLRDTLLPKLMSGEVGVRS